MPKIIVAGGTGFIGRPLVARLAEAAEVAVLSRNPAAVPDGRGIGWDDPALDQHIGEADAIVNLAGENLGEGRWTAAKKRRLVESRVGPTTRIVEALRKAPRKERVLVNASAVGYYGSRGDEILTESSSQGNDFMAQICAAWEGAAGGAEGYARVVILRFGVVLAADGSILARLRLPFTLFAGGPVGNGRQWMSWIDRADLIALIQWAIGNPAASGVYNGTSPAPVTNRQFVKALGAALHRPALVPAPAFALKAAFGEMAEGLLLSSQRAVPERPTAEGFVFGAPTVRESLSRAFA